MSYRMTRAGVLATAAAALALPSRPTVAQALEKIRLAGVPSDDMVPEYYAVKTGMYQKAGLDVEIIPTSSGSAATTAIVAGSYEMGKGSPIASFLAHLRGLPLVVVGTNTVWDVRRPFNVITVATDSNIKTGADLNGKIACSPGLNDINTLAISAWMDKNGGDSKTLKWVEIPLSAAGAALAEHRVDVAALLEPALTAAVETGKVRILAPGFNAIAERFIIGLLFANADWAAKHPDAVKKWMRVTYEAGAYTNTHRSETAQLMSDITKIPLPLFAKMTRAETGTTATADPALLQPLIDTAAKYNHIPRAFPARDLYFKG
jgi:NitT/TauT family transport system substrate-binding protein